jgi:hypothetical protein
MKYIQIILIGAFMLIGQKNNAQMVTSNIQSNLLNKNWSSDPNSDKAVMFVFKETQLYVYSNGNEIGYEDYYLTNTDSTFNDSDIGSVSSGNYIKTRRLCYVIEFYSDFKKFRIRAKNSPKWQDYYLLN